MSSYEGHISAGAATSMIPVAFSAVYNGLDQLWLVFLTSVIFSLYPDMDTGSKSRRFIVIVSLAPATYFANKDMMNSLVALALLIIIPTAFKHRGFVHSLIGMVLFGGIYVYMVDMSIGMVSPSAYAIAISTGYLTHMALDKHFKLV